MPAAHRRLALFAAVALFAAAAVAGLTLAARHALAAPRALAAPVRLPDVDAPDPFVVFHAGRPWLFTTNTAGRNVPAATFTARGRTLVTDALPVLPAWAEPGYTWAPAVAPTADGWTLWFTARHGASGRQCIGAARAARPGGPYAPLPDPLVCDFDAGGSIDPSPVADGAGGLVLLYKADGNCCDLPTTIEAIALDPTGTATAGAPVQLLRADLAWEAGLVEAPSMRADPSGGWLLVYSANRWDTDAYGLGAAHCDTPLGPCRKQPNAALDDPSHPGAGGAELVPGRRWVVLHEWTPGEVGYDAGGHRRVRVGRVDASCGSIVIRVFGDDPPPYPACDPTV